MLLYNLQFFAKEGPGGEKTEPATEKKLRDARKEGQVAKSKEIGNAFGLLALFLVLKFYVGFMGNRFIGGFSSVYSQIPEYIKMYDGQVPVTNINTIFSHTVLDMLLIMGPILIVGVVVAFLCDVVQVKWQPTEKKGQSISFQYGYPCPCLFCDRPYLPESLQGDVHIVDIALPDDVPQQYALIAAQVHEPLRGEAPDADAQISLHIF